MSLLIKALDKAQQAKALAAQLKPATEIEQNTQTSQADVNAKRKPSAMHQQDVAAKSANQVTAEKLAALNALEMELSPVSKNTNNPSLYSIKSADKPISSMSDVSISQAPVSSSKANASSKASAKSAANVFSAKRIESNNRNSMLALIAALGLSVLLAAAAYFYLFMDNEPDFVIAKRPATMPASTASVAPVSTLSSEKLSNQPVSGVAIERPPAPSAIEQAVTQPENSAIKTANTPKLESLAENTMQLAEAPMALTPKSKPKQTTTKMLDVVEIASKSASIEVSKTKPQLAVNPVLMDAYNAYNAGDDAVASKLYRQVLQQDLRNVDALLGLGAIAQRQGRIADANGWYGKVLELEPRNALAVAAVLQSQPQNNVASSESRIKNMLAKHPDDPNLHATLGNFYADLNQWGDAQQAYFEAYRLNLSADNAFNLAVSLDQLGKSALALPYYQRALQLAQSGSTNIDKNALQARIEAIQ